MHHLVFPCAIAISFKSSPAHHAMRCINPQRNGTTAQQLTPTDKQSITQTKPKLDQTKPIRAEFESSLYLYQMGDQNEENILKLPSFPLTRPCHVHFHVLLQQPLLCSGGRNRTSSEH
jgi:hypothetical protein